MQQFKTLMLREWLQQRGSWLRMGIWIPIIFWAAMYAFILQFGLPDFQNSAQTTLQTLTNLGLDYLSNFIIYLALIGILLMIPGLPYRDLDDKSFAFWRSLPITDQSSIIAPILMNALILPLMAIMIAITLNLVLSTPLWIAELTPKLALDLLLVYCGSALQAAFTLIWFLPLVLLLAVGNSMVRRWGMVIILISMPLLETILVRLFNYHPDANFISIYFSGLTGIQSNVNFLNYFSNPINLELQFIGLLRYIVNWPFVFVLLTTALTIYALILRRQSGHTA